MSDTNLGKIQVVFPIHNEGASIRETLIDFYTKASALTSRPIEIIACEDGSRDNTVEVLRALEKEIPLKLITSPHRKGYSRAVMDGLLAADAELVCCMDSDGQYEVNDLGRFISEIEHCDMVVGYRNPRVDHWSRIVMSGLFKFVYSLFFHIPLKDPSCPFLLMRREVIAKIVTPTCGILKQGFWWEFYARAFHAKIQIHQIPVIHLNRLSGNTQVYHPSKVPGIAYHHLLGLWTLKQELS